jgi:colicin import membrane protein
MPAFVREHLRPLLGSAGLHLVLLGMLAGGVLNWRSSQPPVQLAIEGVVVDARSLPKSGRTPSSQPTPRPQPVAEPPKPLPMPETDSLVRQTAAKEAETARAEAETERRQATERQARAKAEAEERKAAEALRMKQAEEQARLRKQAEEDARQAAAEAERRKTAEAEALRRKEEQARAAQDAKLRAEREAELRRQLAAEEEAGATAARAGAIDEYRSLLAQTIERNWIRPPSARAGLECTLYVTQAPGGTVVDVKLGACNGDQAVRESITNAVYRASPLPAPRDPRAFERRLEIVFRPTE